MYLASGLQSYLEVFEYYFSKFGSNTIEPIIWVEFSIMLIIGFIIRAYLLTTFELSKIEKTNKEAKKKVLIYCCGHVAYEFIIAYIICFCLINFTNANPKSFFINAIICPGAGFIVGMVFDNKIIMKLEESNGIASISKEDLINIETSEEDVEAEPEPDPIICIPQEDDSGSSEEGLKKINVDQIQALDAQLVYKMVTTINNIIDTNNNSIVNINELSNRIDLLENIISTLKEIEKNDKKLEIKSLIYRCLNEGYVKPEEDTVITTKYNSYMELVNDEDSEIKSLYENRYLKLEVHEDRRKIELEVTNDRRKAKNNDEFSIASEG